MLPMKKDGTPLCFIDEYRCNPHAWVKLWKHHAAQPEADQVNETARNRDEPWLEYYGSKISSEWFIPKALQILNEAPEIYQAADSFIEAADWVILQLTGEEKRNSCTAGYKAIWDSDSGYPSSDYFRELHPDFEDIINEKLTEDIYPIGEKAGGLTGGMSQKTGLVKGTPVAVANVDAHVSVPAATIISPGKMLMIMGTSICHMVLGEEKKPVEGQCGVVRDGIIPRYYVY